MCSSVRIYVSSFVREAVYMFIRLLIYVCLFVRRGEWWGERLFSVIGAVAISKNRAVSRTFPERGKLLEPNTQK